MKKILILFVMVFGLMSFTSIENVNIVSNDDIANVSEVLNHYEISINYEEDLNLYTCTITFFFPDFTTRTVTGTSLVNGKMACANARAQLTAAEE